MHVLISVDMEGATGVTAPEDVLPGTPAYERFRRLLMSDVNAAIAELKTSYTGPLIIGADLQCTPVAQ